MNDSIMSDKQKNKFQSELITKRQIEIDFNYFEKSDLL